MTSTRPYLIRAFYDWIIDNNCTPHLVVNAGFEGVQVPREYVDNGQIVLNVSVTAVQGLVLGDKAIEFQARFGGKVYKIYAPVISILAIYAKENGRGMVFAEEENMEHEELEMRLEDNPYLETEGCLDMDDSDHDESGGGKGSGGKSRGRGHLSLVK